jgi:hypothetical protein
MAQAEMKLVEQSAGEGHLVRSGAPLGRVRYRISRYQGMLIGSGMPIPGLHRVEGTIAFGDGTTTERLIGVPLALTLDDGRTLAVTVADATGRVLNEGHGPGCCSCC